MFEIIGPTYKISKSLLRRVAQGSFEYLGEEFEINLRFVSKDKIRELSRIYRHEDKPTNVLSFPSDNGGDVVISLAQARKNAQCWRYDLQHVVVLLLLHGILHLAGFGHTKEPDRVKMEKAEKEILGKIGVNINR